MWKWLIDNGFDEEGITEEQLAAGKAMYRRIYQRDYQRQRRKERPTVCISLSKIEYRQLEQAAKKHQLSIGSFLRASAFCYLNQTYLVPNQQQITELREYLALMGYGIQQLTEKAQSTNLDTLVDGYQELHGRVISLEQMVYEKLTHPPLVS